MYGNYRHISIPPEAASDTVSIPMYPPFIPMPGFTGRQEQGIQTLLSGPHVIEISSIFQVLFKYKLERRVLNH